MPGLHLQIEGGISSGNKVGWVSSLGRVGRDFNSFEGELEQGSGRGSGRLSWGWDEGKDESLGQGLELGAWDRGWNRGLVRLVPGRRLLDRRALATAADIPSPHHNIQHSNTLQTRGNAHKYKTEEHN